jgi:hypothetical protein
LRDAVCEYFGFMCHLLDAETLEFIVDEVKGAKNYPKPAAQKPKQAIFTEPPPKIAEPK